jgi:hypothetical protein
MSSPSVSMNSPSIYNPSTYAPARSTTNPSMSSVTNTPSPRATVPSNPISNCANPYLCPGGGTGYGIQFTIKTYDIDSITVPESSQFSNSIRGLTVTAAAESDYKVGISQTDTSLTWWWNNFVLNYPGLVGPTSMSCIQPGQSGFAIGLAQSITSAFSISPSRVCNASLHPSMAGNDIDIDYVKFTFYITDVHPRSTPLANDYLPSTCLGNWIMLWLSKSTSVLQPNLSTIPVTASIPPELQSLSCPALAPGAPSPTLYFTSEINIDKNKLLYIESIKDSFRPAFSQKSILSNVFIKKNIEHATNLMGTSVILNGKTTTIYSSPQTIVDYYAMYAYPLSFIGAMLFTVVQIMDVNINTMVVNKNLSMIINISFIAWSIISLSVYYNIQTRSIPIIGDILTSDVPFVLPYNSQVVITQV